jgi:hypothetical protein
MEPTDAPATQDKPIDSPPSEEEAAPVSGPEQEPGQPTEGEPESFMDFDPESIPDDADREWLANQYGEMRKAFTQKTMGLSEQRREAEQVQSVLDGLRDPEMAPHFLRLLGFDPTSQDFLDKFGLELDDGEGGEGEPEELDPNDRIERLEEELASRDEEAQRSRAEEALEDFMAEQIENLESEFGREFDEREIAFLRTHAERNPDARGVPDVQSASKLLKGMFDQEHERRLEQRKQGSRPPGEGRPGGKAPDKSTSEGLLQAAKEAAEREIASG